MKQKLIMSLIALILLSVTVSATTMTVDSANYSPTPAQPGEYVQLWVHVKNDSSFEAEDAIFNLNLKKIGFGGTYPFSLEPGIDSQKDLGTIKPRQTVLVKYNFLVDSEAPDGTYTINLETGDEGEISKSTSYTITVTSKNPQIEIIETSLIEAAPGQKIDIELVLKNIGTGKAIDLLVGLEEDRTITATGTIVEREIMSLGTSFDYLENLEVDKSKTAKISLAINPDAEFKIYTIPIIIKYKDEDLVEYTKTRYIGLKVSEEPDLSAVISKVEPLATPDAYPEVSFDIFNVGIGPAKFLVVEIGNGIGDIEQKEIFIGTLEANDFDSFKTKIKLNKGLETGEHPIKLKFNYKNQYGENKSFTKTVYLKVYSPQEVASLETQDMPIWFYAIAIIVIVLAGNWGYKKFVKK